MPRRETISDSVRRLIRDCGMSQYELWKASDVDKGALSRFMNGKGGLTLRSLDRLAETLGWEIVVTQDRRTLKAKTTSKSGKRR